MNNDNNENKNEKRPVGFPVGGVKQKIAMGNPAVLEEFPLVVAAQFVKLEGKWVKFYRVYNSDGEPVSGTPRTKEELLSFAKQFIQYLEEN